MQYHIQTLVKHLFDKDSFEQVSAEELKQFTEEYPYAAVGQFLYAKKLKDNASHSQHDQNEQVSLYFHNPLWLRWQLEQKEEAPALPLKAEEPAQQPGFRIVVQMPKTEEADTTVSQPEEKQEEETQPAPETAAIVAAAEATEPAPTVQPETTDTTPPTQEEAITEAEKSLLVNENGSLEEQAGAIAEQTAEETTAPAENTSTVAIAEASQLAEESMPAEAPVNAVSITEEVLTPGAVDKVEHKEADDIIPAVEVPAEVADVNTVKGEVDDIVPAVEITAKGLEAVEEAPDEVVPAVEVPIEERTQAEPTLAETIAATRERLSKETPTPEALIPEEQPVEPVTETITEEAAPAFAAETEQPVTAEEVVDNTANTLPPVEAVEPTVEQEEAGPAPALAQSFKFSLAGHKEKGSVDLGEPIFESYHTIDYFASLGIKLMQDDLKDKMGKQLKSFTDWLRSMKRIGPIESNTSLDEVTNQSIQRIAEHSVEGKEVLTEAMAEVWAKQGNPNKAIRIYEKLSLLNPGKSPYFAGRIEQLKAQ